MDDASVPPSEDADLIARARAWLAQDPDPHTRAQLARWVLAHDMPPLRRAFAGRLRFGTAGLRAPMGPGPMGLNQLVVVQSVAGIAEVLVAQVPDARTRGVAVGFDGRHNSRAFAMAAAGVLLAQGFAVFLLEDGVPTPVVGFWVKLHKLAAGVVVTASHNPPEYNGIKVYWQDGAQIVSPQDRDIAAAIDKVAVGPSAPACLQGAQLTASPKLSWVAAAANQAYLAALRAHAAPPASAPVTDAPKLKLAYTPLHGVGGALARAVAEGCGFAELHEVAEQAAPDGSFPTVRFPNPEEPGAMDAVLALAEARGCALACANDPDADRLAVAARDKAGKLRLLSGDELGILLADHCLRAPHPGAEVATTRVSSRMLAQLARARGVGYVETLTGFKWLARAGLEAAADGRKLVFAYEEALGYAVTDLVADKDGISALLVTLQLAREHQLRGTTLFGRLAELHAAHGLHVSTQRTVPTDGGGGEACMRALRAALPQRLGQEVLLAHDDLAQSHRSDVVLLYYGPEGMTPAEARKVGLRAIVRPSGTEPKVKIYLERVALGVSVDDWASRREALNRQLAEDAEALRACLA